MSRLPPAAVGRDRVDLLRGVERDAHDAHERIDRELRTQSPRDRQHTPVLAADAAHRGEDRDVVVELRALGAGVRIRLRAQRVLVRQRTLAVAVGDHAVGHARHEPDDVDPQHVARPGADHVDRPGDDVRAVGGEVVSEVRGGDRLRVVEHVALAHALAAEVGDRVASLVLEDALVRDRVERDQRARAHAADRLRGPIRQVAPADRLRRRGDVAAAAPAAPALQDARSGAVLGRLRRDALDTG